VVYEKLGDFGGASSEQSAQILGDYRQSAIGETLLVDQGLKPLYHENGVFTPEKAQEFVALIKKLFPHVAVWHPHLIQDIINADKVNQIGEQGDAGNLGE